MGNRLYRERHPEKNKEKSRLYYRTHRDKLNAAAREKRKKRPEMVRAGNAVQNAIRAGRLIRGRCQARDCDIAETHGHHADYSKPRPPARRGRCTMNPQPRPPLTEAEVQEAERMLRGLKHAGPGRHSEYWCCATSHEMAVKRIARLRKALETVLRQHGHVMGLGSSGIGRVYVERQGECHCPHCDTARGLLNG